MRITAEIHMTKRLEFESPAALCHWLKVHDGEYDAIHAETVKTENIRQGRDTNYSLIGEEKGRG